MPFSKKKIQKNIKQKRKRTKYPKQLVFITRWHLSQNKFETGIETFEVNEI